MAAAAHVFVDDLDDPLLGEDDTHHLARVLRLDPGQAVTASDGAGRWRLCRWRGSGGSARLEPDGPVVVDARPAPAVAVGFALPKGGRPEWVVAHLTEVGVDGILPLYAGRSVVRWDGERAARHLERLRRVAREAAMQSRRTWLPELAPPRPAAEVAAGLGPGALAQFGGGPPSLERPTILVGPEGGWTEAELSCGLPMVGLGPTVLRAETAAVAAGVVLCGLRAGTVRPA